MLSHSRSRTHRLFHSCRGKCVSRMCPCWACCQSSRFSLAVCRRDMMTKRNDHLSCRQISRSPSVRPDMHQTSILCHFRSSTTIPWSAPSKELRHLGLYRGAQCLWLRVHSHPTHRCNDLKWWLRLISSDFCSTQVAPATGSSPPSTPHKFWKCCTGGNR